MRCRLAVGMTVDGRLLVTMEALWGFPEPERGSFFVTPVDDENAFLQRVVLAGLSQEDTIALVANVLLAVSGRPASEQWVALTLSELQMLALGLYPPHVQPAEKQVTHSPLGFHNMEDLHEVFRQAPVAVCMLQGSEHIITFLNESYVKLLGRKSDASLLARPVREALSDLEGQPFFALMDRVYRTGEPYIGVEMLAHLYNESSHTFEDAYFDFIYHPVRDRLGEVCGILCQATNVTERVLDKQVRESREAQLYRQWAELNAIYRDSPLAMCLVDAKNLTILRLNETKAQFFGGTPDDFIGRKITEVVPAYTYLEEVYRGVIQSKTPRTMEVVTEPDAVGGTELTLLWNLNPVFGASGHVDAVACTVLDVTDRPVRMPSIMQSAYGPRR